MNNLYVKNSYSVDNQTSIPFEERDYSPYTKMPPPTKNGGLYGGKQSNSPWMPIPITPTSTNFMLNLKSANPPPGAMEQYIGSVRLGNNYSAMPNLKWYVPKKNTGPYNIVGIDNY